MKLELKNKKFSVSNLDYEMVQIILNGIEYITTLNNQLNNLYINNTETPFSFVVSTPQIKYLKNHNEKLNEIVNEFSLLIEKTDL